MTDFWLFFCFKVFIRVRVRFMVIIRANVMIRVKVNSLYKF